MTRVRAVVVLAAIVVGVGACSGEIMTNRLYLANTDSFFRFGASAGEMKTVVVGNPFPVSKATLDKRVTAAMQNNHHGPMTHFTTNPGPKAYSNFRVVVAFNIPPKVDASRVLCGAPAAIPTGSSGTRLHATVGFCMDTDLYSSVNISIPAVASPDDPRFSHMIASAMWELIPVRDPLSSDEDAICLGTAC